MTIIAIVVILPVHASTAAASDSIPPLLEIPSAIAQMRPDLVEERATLVEKRDSLRLQFQEHNAQCRSVEAGSAQDKNCVASRDGLSAALQQHIADSNSFNNDVRAAISERDALKDAPRAQEPDPYWASAKTRNDCKRLFYRRVKSHLVVAPRGGIVSAMGQANVAYQECLKGKPPEEPGVTDCGFSGLFARCWSSYKRNGGDGDEDALKSFTACYQGAIEAIDPRNGVCFHE